MYRIVTSLVFLICLIFSTSVFASVTDEAGLLTGSELSQLNSKIQQIEHKHGIRLNIVTQHELQGPDVKSAANNLLRRMVESPQSGANGNIVFLIALDVRKWQIAADRNIESKIYDSNGHAAFNEKAFVSKFSQGDYLGGFATYIDSIDKALDDYSRTGQVYGNANFDANEEDKGFDLIAAMISVVAAIIIAGMYRSSLIASMSNVRPAVEASEYLDKNNIQIIENRDNFLYMNVRRQPKSRGGGSSGGGGGSSGGGHGGSF